MPGPIIEKMLQPYNHQNFYIMTRLFHRELIRRESEAALQVDLALHIVTDSRFPDMLKNKDQHRQLHDILFGLTQLLENLVDHTRQSNFRCHKTEDFDPYDSAMWDAFFSEIAPVVSSLIGDIRATIQQLKLPDLAPSSDAKPIQALMETKSVVERHLNEIEKFLVPDMVEGWIACERIELQTGEIKRLADDLLRQLNEPAAVEFATRLRRNASSFSDNSIPLRKEFLPQYGTLLTTINRISFEFRGPLTSMRGYAQLLGTEGLPPPQSDLIDQIQHLGEEIWDWTTV